jgi:tRNA-specific 2-thiouridylase
VCWSGGRPPLEGTPIGVRIRHRHPLVPARLERCERRQAVVAFEDDGPLVTPGQAAVFYREDRVLGGGWIAEDLPA